eukprot:jgi/Mesvir1/20123/Mv13362-RA.1
MDAHEFLTYHSNILGCQIYRPIPGLPGVSYPGDMVVVNHRHIQLDSLVEVFSSRQKRPIAFLSNPQIKELMATYYERFNRSPIRDRVVEMDFAVHVIRWCNPYIALGLIANGDVKVPWKSMDITEKRITDVKNSLDRDIAAVKGEFNGLLKEVLEKTDSECALLGKRNQQIWETVSPPTNETKKVEALQYLSLELSADVLRKRVENIMDTFDAELSVRNRLAHQKLESVLGSAAKEEQAREVREGKKLEEPEIGSWEGLLTSYEMELMTTSTDPVSEMLYCWESI